MINCQYSFGSMVGAPVLFFLGGFVFALLQSLQDLGSEDIAMALAFGQFYMTVPHIAIVSGLLLAGNNPNILEGVFATQRNETETPKRIFGLEFGLAYPSCYKVAWQWHRGHNKRQWIELLIDTYSQRDIHDIARTWDNVQDNNLEDLRNLGEKTTPSLLDWILILSMTGFLLGTPFVLAFITAFYTPEVGLSCRSFTFTCYAISQIGQMILWFWEVSFSYFALICQTQYWTNDFSQWNPNRVTDSRGQMQNTGPRGVVRQERNTNSLALLDVFRAGGWLDRNGFYEPRSVSHFIDPSQPHSLKSLWKAVTSKDFRDIRSVWCCVWYLCYTFCCGLATFAAVGGTLMQVLGLYSAELCNLTMGYWIDPFQPGVTAMISKNSKLMLDDAQRYWKPCAITAIVFMSFVSFVGWWYQRRLRDLFRDLVSKIDDDKFARRDSWLAKHMHDGTDHGVQRHLWGSPPI